MSDSEVKTKVLELVANLSQTYLPRNVRGYFTSNVLTLSTPSIPTDQTQATASDLQNYHWNLFLDQTAFNKVFGNQINLPGSNAPWNVRYMIQSNNQKFYQLYSDAHTAETPLSLQSLYQTSDLLHLNFSGILTPPTPPTTDQTEEETVVPLNLLQILDDITILSEYDYSHFNRANIPVYRLNEEGTEPLTETIVFGKENFQKRFEPYLKNLGTLVTDRSLKDSTNFYVFRRIMLLLRILIHMRIANYIDDRVTTRPTQFKTIFGNAMEQILNNIVNQFDDKTRDDFNYVNFYNDTMTKSTDFYKQIGVIKDLDVQIKAVQNQVGDQMKATTQVKKLTMISWIILISALITSGSGLAFTFSPMNKLTPKVTLYTQLSLGTIIASIIFYMITNYYSLEPFEDPAPVDLDLVSFYTQCVKFLNQTSSAANMLQTSQIFNSATTIQHKDSRTMQLYREQLEKAYGELSVVNKIIERKQRNNIATMWLILGWMLIGFLTALFHAVAGGMRIARLMTLIIGGLIAFLYTAIMLYAMYTRTRRDPSKYYWGVPPITISTNESS